MNSAAISARMREVSAAAAAVRSAQSRLHAPMQDADRLIRGATQSAILTSNLVGGAASGADLRISSRLNQTAEGGKRFKSRLQDAYAQLNTRAVELDVESERLEIELEEELEAEAAERAARRW